jgi:hypothetical protein
MHIHWLKLMLLFIVDDSVVVPIYVHSAVSTVIWVGLGSLTNGRYEDLMACKCDVSCATTSRVPRPTQMAIDTAEWPYTATRETPIIKNSNSINQCMHMLCNVKYNFKYRTATKFWTLYFCTFYMFLTLE